MYVADLEWQHCRGEFRPPTMVSSNVLDTQICQSRELLERSVWPPWSVTLFLTIELDYELSRLWHRAFYVGGWGEIRRLCSSACRDGRR